LVTRAFSSHKGVNLTPRIKRFDAPHQGNHFRGPLKACILDWSGTTADMHVIAPAVVFYDVFHKHGVPITMAEARKPMGLRKDLHIAKILEIPEVQERWRKIKGRPSTSQDVDDLFKDFVPMQLACLSKYTTLIPGCVEAVNRLKSEFNLVIGSTTGFTKDMVDILLADARKQGYSPDFSVAGDQVKNNMGFRPAPFMVYENLVQMGIFPIQSVVKVDDTVSGVGEGLNAGCWAVGLAGYSNYTEIDSIEQWENMSEHEKEERRIISREKLYNSGAHYVCESIADLPDVVRDINRRLANGEKP